jgi:hypothetical protein
LALTLFDSVTIAYKGYRLAFSLKDKERMQRITQVMLVDTSGNVLKSVNLSNGDMPDPHYFYFVDSNRFLGYTKLYNFSNGSSKKLLPKSFDLADVHVHLIDGKAVCLTGSREKYKLDISINMLPNGGNSNYFGFDKEFANTKVINLVNLKSWTTTFYGDSNYFFHDARRIACDDNRCIGSRIITVDGKVYK